MQDGTSALHAAVQEATLSSAHNRRRDDTMSGPPPAGTADTAGLRLLIAAGAPLNLKYTTEVRLLLARLYVPTLRRRPTAAPAAPLDDDWLEPSADADMLLCRLVVGWSAAQKCNGLLVHDGFTALQFAVRIEDDDYDGSYDATRLLIEAGADMGVRDDVRRSWTFPSPVHFHFIPGRYPVTWDE